MIKWRLLNLVTLLSVVLYRSKAYRFALILIVSLFYFIFHQYYKILQLNEVNWAEQIIAPFFGNIHFFLLLICPTLVFLIGKGWAGSRSKMFFDMARIGHSERIYVLFFTCFFQLLSIFIFLVPIIPLIKAAGYDSWTYLLILFIGTFLIGLSIITISVFISLVTSNIFFYLFLNMFCIGFFYLIGLIAQKFSNYLVIEFFRYISFSVQYDKLISGFISPEMILYLFSIIIIFMNLSISFLKHQKRQLS